MTPTSKPNTVLILYPPGAYGTFVEWGLMYFTGQLESTQLPFTASGSAHKFTGHSFHVRGGKSIIDWYFKSEFNFPFARCHGGDLNTGSAQHVVEQYGPHLRKIIFINPDLPLLVAHNKIDKISSNHLPDVSNLARWDQREALSFWINTELEFHKLLVDSNNPCVLTINLSELISTPAKVFKEVIEYFDYDLQNWDSHQEIFNAWLLLQKHKEKDHLCNSIVKNAVEDVPFAWTKTELDLIDEAYIQRELRRLHKIELKCYNLNRFPTTTQELRQYFNG